MLPAALLLIVLPVLLICSAIILAALAVDEAADDLADQVAYGDVVTLPLGASPQWVGERVHDLPLTRKASQRAGK